MSKCPVCEKENDSLQCQTCGFDGSRNYEQYPTFGKMVGTPASVSARQAALAQQASSDASSPQKWLIGIVAALLVFAVAILCTVPCLFGHSWVSATCEKPKTCTECGKKEGSAPGHSWIPATCTEPKTCSVCGKTDWVPLGHSYTDDRCTRCGDMIWEENMLRYDPFSGLRNNGVDDSKVQKVVFLDDRSQAPMDAWDVSADKNRNVLAWAKNANGLYTVYFAAEGGINAKDACPMLFSYMYSLQTIDFGNAFHTEQASSMHNMFVRCEKLSKLDLSSFDTSNVTGMSHMFELCENLTSLDLSSWDTSRVTMMNNMFSNCKKLTSVKVGSWDTSKVTNMQSMFANCTKLQTLNVSNWDTSKVTNMEGMFSGCDKLWSLDVRSWDVSNVRYHDNFMPDGRKLNNKPWKEFFN